MQNTTEKTKDLYINTEHYSVLQKTKDLYINTKHYTEN